MPLRPKSPLFLASLGSLILGYLVIAFPQLLNYFVGILLIVLGIAGLYRHIKAESQTPGNS